MSMSDCIDCWSTPCCCGLEFKDYTSEKLTKFIVSTLKYHPKEESIKILKDSLKIVLEETSKV